VGVVIVVISMLLSIDMVNTETSVAAIITNRLEREKCVLEGDLVAVGQENIYRSQSVNIFEGTLTQIRQNGIDIPVPDTAFADFEKNQFVGEVVQDYLTDTELRVKAGLSDLFVLGAGLYSGSVGECFISAGRFTGITDAIRVDRGDPNNLIIIADSAILDKLDMELSVQDSAGNSIVLPVAIYGGTYVSDFEIIKFIRFATDAVFELGSEVNRGLCAEKPGAICDDPCESAVKISDEPMSYSEFEDMVINEILLPKAYGRLSQIKNLNFSCSVEFIDRFNTPNGQMSSNGLYSNFLIGVDRITCEILDNRTGIFKITAGPFYFRHHDYLQNDREPFGIVQESLSCGVTQQQYETSDIVAPVMELQISSTNEEFIGQPIIFTINEVYGEEGLFGTVRIYDSNDRIIGGVDFDDEEGGEYVAVFDTRDIFADHYRFEIILQDDGGNSVIEEAELDLIIAPPTDLTIETDKLTWTAPFGRISEYYIYCSPDSGVEIKPSTYCDYTQVEEVPIGYSEPTYLRVVAREITGTLGTPSDEIHYTPPSP
jgi:hypothetical protein